MFSTLILSVKHAVCLFVGLECPFSLVFRSFNYDFLKLSFYSSRWPKMMFFIRFFGPLAVYINPNLDVLLPEFQFTESWLKYVYYLLLLHLYWSMPCMWIRFQRLIHNYPKKWQQFCTIFSHLGSNGKHVRKTSSSPSLVRNLYFCKVVIRFCVLCIFLINVFFLVTLVWNLNRRISKSNGWIALTIQLLWAINYKLVYNCMGLSVGVMLIFMYISCLHLEYQAQLLNKKMNSLNRRLCTVSSGHESIFRFKPFILNVCHRLALICRKAQFANNLVTYDSGQAYMVVLFHSIFDVFLAFYSLDLSVGKYFVYVFYALLPMPVLILPCTLANNLLQQVNFN